MTDTRQRGPQAGRLQAAVADTRQRGPPQPLEDLCRIPAGLDRLGLKPSLRAGSPAPAGKAGGVSPKVEGGAAAGAGGFESVVPLTLKPAAMTGLMSGGTVDAGGTREDPIIRMGPTGGTACMLSWRPGTDKPTGTPGTTAGAAMG